MCLTIPPFPATHEMLREQGLGKSLKIFETKQAAAATLGGHGDAISCDGAVVVISRTSPDKLAVAHIIPVSNESGVDAAIIFPIRHEHAETIVPCGQMPCLLSEIKAIFNPKEYVQYDEEKRYIGPVYRGFSPASSGRPAPKIETLKVIQNPDGGVTAIIPMAKCIGQTAPTHDELAALAEPMLACIVEGCDSAGIERKRVFGADYEEGDVEGTFGVIGHLLTSVSVGCDIVLAILPIGARAATFTLLCHVDVSPGAKTTLPTLPTLPMLGLAHGDMDRTTHVPNHYYVMTNDPSIELVFPPDALRNGEVDGDGGCRSPLAFADTGKFVSYKFLSDENYVDNFEAQMKSSTPSLATAAMHSSSFAASFALMSVDGKLRAIEDLTQYARMYDGPYGLYGEEMGDNMGDNKLWGGMQLDFQREMKKQIVAKVDNFLQASVGTKSKKTLNIARPSVSRTNFGDIFNDGSHEVAKAIEEAKSHLRIVDLKGSMLPRSPIAVEVLA